MLVTQRLCAKVTIIYNKNAKTLLKLLVWAFLMGLWVTIYFVK
jgi:hypothetical protein